VDPRSAMRSTGSKRCTRRGGSLQPTGWGGWRSGSRTLTLRQFVSYLLGYLCFVALTTLGLATAAPLVHDTVVGWFASAPTLGLVVWICGITVLSLLLSILAITVLWALYFLTDVVNRPAADRDFPAAQ
jgi:hypothetical protein